MSAKNRIPNRLKFKLVYSDHSMIEGTAVCSDEQGQDIVRVLWPRKGYDAGIEAAFAKSKGQV